MPICIWIILGVFLKSISNGGIGFLERWSMPQACQCLDNALNRLSFLISPEAVRQLDHCRSLQTVLFYSTPILFYSNSILLLFYSILFYSILFYSILFYSTLFYFFYLPAHLHLKGTYFLNSESGSASDSKPCQFLNHSLCPSVTSKTSTYRCALYILANNDLIFL